ncbi:hypothetical protein BC827DRAFT_1155744 [Russula dissimulans]|nr:hypothetical protein BC827DRAFT_1155744 [Russula dissimulans]
MSHVLNRRSSIALLALARLFASVFPHQYRSGGGVEQMATDVKRKEWSGAMVARPTDSCGRCREWGGRANENGNGNENVEKVDAKVAIIEVDFSFSSWPTSPSLTEESVIGSKIMPSASNLTVFS